MATSILKLYAEPLIKGQRVSPSPFSQWAGRGRDPVWRAANEILGGLGQAEWGPALAIQPLSRLWGLSEPQALEGVKDQLQPSYRSSVGGHSVRAYMFPDTRSSPSLHCAAD